MERIVYYMVCCRITIRSDSARTSATLHDLNAAAEASGTLLPGNSTYREADTSAFSQHSLLPSIPSTDPFDIVRNIHNHISDVKMIPKA
jgi:hypothetical protein